MVVGQPIDRCRCHFRAVQFGDCDGSVEDDDRRRFYVDQLVVAGNDL
jgi:hypothetical protein